MEEKMKAPLFQTVVSYWVISNTPEDAESKLSNIQAVLTEINQKNMNMLKHQRLFTKQVEQLEASGQLKEIIDTKPILKNKRLSFLPKTIYSSVIGSKIFTVILPHQ